MSNWRQVFALNELPDKNLQELEDLKNEKSIVITITSDKTDPSNNDPTDTVAYYQVSRGSKKIYFTDADSGEQHGVATTIPAEVKKILLAFGHDEEVDQNDNVVRYKQAASPGREKRIYEFTGSSDQLDTLEYALAFMTWCNTVGASRKIVIFTDGDGAANIQVKRVKGDMKEITEDMLQDGELDSEVEYTNGDTLEIGIGT
jgi:hypothetical protein